MSYFYLVPVIIVFGSFYYFSRSGPTKSLRETYDDHFNTLWSAYGEEIGKLFNRLNDKCFKSETYYFFYVYNNRYRIIPVRLLPDDDNPTMFIHFSIPDDNYRNDLPLGHSNNIVGNLVSYLGLEFDSAEHCFSDFEIKCHKDSRKVIVSFRLEKDTC
jgi:hypothetical protein